MKKTSSKISSETSKNLLSDVYKRVQKDTRGVKWFKQLSSHLTLHDGGPYYIETSPLICTANQWTGFYMIGTFLMKE